MASTRPAAAGYGGLIRALQKLQNEHKSNLEKLRSQLAKALKEDDLKQIRSLNQSQYDDYEAEGVYLNRDMNKPFPYHVNMSSSVPQCTMRILSFLRKFRKDAEKVTGDWRELMDHCLREIFTKVLPEELKKSLEHRRITYSDVKGAETFYENIKRLRSSLHNPNFSKIKKECHSKLQGLKTWKIWDELVKDSEKIIVAIQKNAKQPVVIKPTK
ncbi:hypothetical protein M758_9G152500 [Ceratodon purpureus]|nr:hypothetical protein M758_9G152500 [Ceratodon purpureus]